jgi:hypothetical protein
MTFLVFGVGFATTSWGLGENRLLLEGGSKYMDTQLSIYLCLQLYDSVPPTLVFEFCIESSHPGDTAMGK